MGHRRARARRAAVSVVRAPAGRVCGLITPFTLCRPDHPADAPPFVLPSPLPVPPRKALPATPPTGPAPSLKRGAPDEEILELEPTAKRARTNGAAPPDAIASPSKKRRLDEDGLILMESAGDRLDDDVIEID